MFPKENVLILFYELMDDPEGYLRRIHEFLGIDPDFVSPLVRQRIDATATLSAKSKIKKLAYRGFIRLRMFRFAKFIESNIQQEQPPLEPEVRKRVLNTYFPDEIKRLEEMLGLDLSQWRAA